MKHDRPAFPSTLIDDALHIPSISLRDYLAARAMQGLLTKHGLYNDDAYDVPSRKERRRRESSVPINELVAYAYAVADEMLKVRGQT